MSRYIDAEWLIPQLKTVADRPVQSQLYIVRLAPSIDIVRCKECKWAKANGTYQWCGRLDSTARITADDYCSYGEVRDE